MSTCKDVAKKAGVSIASVSRAFREDISMKADTRDKILQIAREMNYYPNTIARSLKNNHRLGGMRISPVHLLPYQEHRRASGHDPRERQDQEGGRMGHRVRL